MKALGALFLLFAVYLPAAEVTGKWSGSYDTNTGGGETMNGKVMMVLNQNGADLSGTVGAAEEQQSKIINGHVDGDQITFESQTEGPLMKFTLRLEQDHLRGEAKGDIDGNTIRVKLDLTRKTE